MRRLRARSLSGLIRLNGIGFAFVTAALGLATYGIVHETIEQQLDDRIAAESSDLLAAGGDLAGVEHVVRAREARHGAGDLGYIVVDRQGRRVAGTLHAPIPPDGASEFLHFEHSDGDMGIAQALNAAIPGGGRLVVAADRAGVDKMDRIIFSMFGLAFGLVVIAGLGSALALGRIVRTRLSLLGETAEGIMAGDLARRLPMTGDAEFDQIASAINRMLERIEHLLSNLRQLSTDIAHDIRTPLNRVRLSLEALRGAQPGPAEEVDLAIREIDALLELLAGLLGISEIEGFAVRKRFEPVALTALIEDVADGYSAAAASAETTLVFTGEVVEIRGDKALLRRLCANLIDNALLHAAGATRIEVRVERAGSRACLVVTDDGPGIAAEEHENVFRRFVRLEQSRTTLGHGLGLNMVQAIARAHHGSAQIVPTASGLTICVSFPLNQAGATSAQ